MSDRPKILVVDDNSDIRETLASTLAQAGYRVTCAENGEKALEALESGLAAELVILDLTMPVMDGWQFLDAVNTNAKLAGLPILVLSSVPHPGMARPHLGKHMSIEHLLASVEAALPSAS